MTPLHVCILSSIIKIWCQKGHLVNGNKQNWHVTKCCFENFGQSNTASVR